MSKASRRVWLWRLSYRRRKLHAALGRGDHANARKWVGYVNEAKTKLGLPVSTKSRGIDVSTHNGSVDFKRVYKAGYRYVVCKTSEGGDWKDPTWKKARVQAVRDSGLKLGVYHYLRPKAGRTGADEAKFFIKQAKVMGWGKPGDLRPVIDFEETALNNSRTVEYLAQAVREIKALTGKSPIIYTGGPFWDEHTNSSKDAMGCPLWLAAYVKKPEQYLPAAWKKAGWSIWQFTATGGVDGVPTPNVDQNISTRLPLL